MAAATSLSGSNATPDATPGAIPGATSGATPGATSGTPLPAALAAARTYAEYRAHLAALLEEGRTTGDNQSDFYVEIARLNHSRMDRLDKRSRLTDDLQTLLANLRRDYVFLVLSEGWCGDAAQTLPVMNWMAEASPQVTLRVVLRDEHLSLMDEYLTNSGRSIPKLLILDAKTEAVLADWGPRPLVAQALAMRYKRKPAPKEDYATYQKALHTWYARDKTRSTQQELGSLLGWLEQESVG